MAATFLTQADYRPLIREDLLNALTGNNPALLIAAEQAAQAEMASYLRDRYDIGRLFYTDPRDPLLVMYLVDMALYHLSCRTLPIQPQRAARYQAAIAWLESVASGAVNPAFPLRAVPLTAGSATDATILSGGNPKLNFQDAPPIPNPYCQ